MFERPGVPGAFLQTQSHIDHAPLSETSAKNIK